MTDKKSVMEVDFCINNDNASNASNTSSLSPNCVFNHSHISSSAPRHSVSPLNMKFFSYDSSHLVMKSFSISCSDCPYVWLAQVRKPRSLEQVNKSLSTSRKARAIRPVTCSGIVGVGFSSAWLHSKVDRASLGGWAAHERYWYDVCLVSVNPTYRMHVLASVNRLVTKGKTHVLAPHPAFFEEKV